MAKVSEPKITKPGRKILLKIYMLICVIASTSAIVFGYADPWLISQKDTFLVIAGFVLAAATVPVLFLLSAAIISSILELIKR